MYNKIQTRGARKQFAAGDARFHAFGADSYKQKSTLNTRNTSQNPTAVLCRKFLKFSKDPWRIFCFRGLVIRCSLACGACAVIQEEKRVFRLVGAP